MKKVVLSFLIGGLLVISGCSGATEKDVEKEAVIDPEIVGKAAYEEQGEKLVIRNCSECHGHRLEGRVGPPLEDVGSEMSHDQIKKAILEGIGTMPEQEVTDEQAEAMTDWLSKQKKMHKSE